MSTATEMEQYDADTDPRESAVDTGYDPRVPLVTGEAPWLLQVSIKTPAGTLINVRGMEGIDVAAGLAAVRAMTDEILHTEAGFAQQRAAAPQPQQYGPPQQNFAPQQRPAAPPAQPPAGQPIGNQPTCQCGYPAKFVQGGISRKTQRPYPAFWTCGNPVREAECSYRQNA